MKKHKKWQFWCKPFGRDYYRAGGNYGWHIFELAVVKFVEFPREGEMIRKENYKGFIIRFAYWFPVDKA